MPSIETRGATLHYETAGDGPPLLLIAGLAGDNASWAPVWPLLARHFTLIAPDNRGCGRTIAPARFAFADFADDAVALLDALDHPRAHVIGHSLGGMIALDLVTRHAGHVDRLVLAATNTGPEPRAASMFGALARAGGEGISAETALRLFLPWLHAPAFFARPAAVDAVVAEAIAYPWRQTPEGFLAQLGATRGLDLSALPAAVIAPTLLLLGEHDILFPPATSRAAFAAVPGLTERTLDAGHALHWDAPEAFASAAGDFLSA